MVVGTVRFLLFLSRVIV